MIGLNFPIFLKYKLVVNIEKQTIIVVQANPKTNPGGVQGALRTVSYQTDEVPGSVHKLPKAKPPKFNIKNAKRVKQ